MAQHTIAPQASRLPMMMPISAAAGMALPSPPRRTRVDGDGAVLVVRKFHERARVEVEM